MSMNVDGLDEKIQLQLVNVCAAASLAMREKGRSGRQFENEYHSLCSRLSYLVRQGRVDVLVDTARELVSS